MPGTYEPIATQTLGSAVATVTFSSIPGTYTDLVLVANVTATSSGQGQGMQLNGDNGVGLLYSDTILRGNGSTVVSVRQYDVGDFPLSNIAEPPTSGTGTYIAQFMDYSNSTTFKTVLVRSNSAAFATETFVNLWRNTAAITSIKITISGGNYAAGSTFSLYGIKAA